MLKNKCGVWAAVIGVFLTAVALLLLKLFPAPTSKLSPDPELLSTAEYLEQKPLSTPAFILDVSTKAKTDGWFEKTISISFSQEPFARASILANELSQHLSKYLAVKINGFSAKTISWQYLTLSCENSEQISAPSKCWGGPMEVDIDVSSLEPGLHLAELNLFDLDAIKHSYTWAFRYDPNSPTADPNVLPTLAPLPTETPTP